MVSAMFGDYRDLARAVDTKLPVANVVRRDWLEEARPWLSANTPRAALWEMPPHLGFWESPDDFNERLIAFLETSR
jgi:non-heme chloroperoxidase